jgi:hypothetical protein
MWWLTLCPGFSMYGAVTHVKRVMLNILRRNIFCTLSLFWRSMAPNQYLPVTTDGQTGKAMLQSF